MPDAAYAELIEALGEENVSREPAVLDGYAFQSFQNRTPDYPWISRPVAVALPGNAEEVREVILTCNRHGMKFKALSTGWGAWAGPATDNVVQIDLRRMDRILEIDTDNMYAVVEPYVICAQLQAETLKRGLNAHIIGAGSNTSALASATSFGGYGATGLATGWSGRNILGVEWVLPSGEILRLGSLGSGGDWFCGDGPGPSLRGIMRGWLGAAGGLGVFTKCALKLYPWPGPAQPHVEGSGVDMQAEVPETLRTYMCVFPDASSFADAGYRICDAEIGYMLCKHAHGSMIAVLMPRLLRKLAGRRHLKEALDAAAHQFQVILLGNSLEDLELQEDTLRAIMDETGGVLVDLSRVEPMHRMVWWSFIRNSLTPAAFRAGGSFTTTFGSSESFDHAMRQAARGDELKRPYVEKGLFFDDLGWNAWGGMYEGSGHYSHQEVIVMFDPRDRRSAEAVVEFSRECLEAEAEESLGIGIPTPELNLHERLGPLSCNYHVWQGRIKKALDPEDLSESSCYIPPGSPGGE